MLNMNEFLANVKRAAIDAVRAQKPFALLHGTVTGVSPLKVRVDQKFELSAPQLILTSAVRDHTVTVTEADGTEQVFLVHRELEIGERVLLLRADGGQKFLILDRAEAST